MLAISLQYRSSLRLCIPHTCVLLLDHQFKIQQESLLSEQVATVVAGLWLCKPVNAMHAMLFQCILCCGIMLC